MPRLNKYYQKMLAVIGGLFAVVLLMAVFLPISMWLAAGVSVVVLVLTSRVLGLEPARVREQITLNVVIAVTCIIWLVLQFLLGFVFGLTTRVYPHNYFLLYLLPVMVVIVASEVTRANLLRKSGQSKLATLGTTLLVTMIGVLPLLAMTHFTTNLRMTQFVFISLLPWVFSSVFLSFLAIKGGWQATVIFRALTMLPVMVLPLYTSFDDFMSSVVGLGFPVICYLLVYKLVLERAEPLVRKRPNKVLQAVSVGVFLLVATLTTMLFSGLFRFYPLSIATGSMSPHIHVGDFVIVERLDDEGIAELEEGDVLVFEMTGRVIVHRIVAVGMGTHGQPTFVTQGDANNAPDAWVVEKEEVIGTTRLRMPMIGYPTLWVHEILRGA